MPRALAAVVAASVLLTGVGAAGAQHTDRPARTAPAIGPWLGAPRGTITEVEATPDGVRVHAAAVDADSARPIGYRLVVDGRPAGSGTSSAPPGFGEPVAIEAFVAAEAGMHEVCLQLDDGRLGRRTVDCVNSAASVPDTVDSGIAANARGALVSPTGVVMPIVGGRSGAWRVTTPCGATTTLRDGEVVDRARVVVDPGHGGSESGSTGGGLLEKHLNLDVAEAVVALLEERGISAQLTRTFDYRLPIRTRAEIATGLAPDVFVSIHHNGGATRRSSRPGTEVFYAEGMPESRRLASLLYEDMVAALSPFDVAWVSTVSEGASLRRRDDGQDLYGIHRYSPGVTSVITEFLYLSNPPEAALMRRDGLPELEARTIVDSLLRWWWTDDSGTTRGRDFVDSSSSGTGGFDGCVDPPLTAADPAGARAGVLTAATTGSRAESISLLPALFLGRDPAID